MLNCLAECIDARCKLALRLNVTPDFFAEQSLRKVEVCQAAGAIADTANVTDFGVASSGTSGAARAKQFYLRPNDVC